MHLYGGMTMEFVEDVRANRVAGKIADRFKHHFGYSAPDSEVRAWQNSLRSMALAVEGAGLEDNGIVVEYRLPLTSRRLDVMLTGTDEQDLPSSVIVELKQWDDVRESDVDHCVNTFVGGGTRDQLHPSRQAADYQRYLIDTHTAFSGTDITLRSCAYLHNMQRDRAAALFDPRFEQLVRSHPAFIADDGELLQDFLAESVGGGRGADVLERILEGRYRPAKSLLRETARVIKGEPAFQLLDDQRVAFETVLTKLRTYQLTETPTVFIIKGGPGTGKSVIAVNLVAAVSQAGRTVVHATGSKAFTQNLRKVVGSRSAAQFSYFNNFATLDAQSIDVLICDEAHRIRESSATRFTKAADRSGKLQIDELLDVAKIAVFFIDDQQVVRPGEIGSTTLLKQRAIERGAKVVELELEAQFRCGGSDAYLRWIANTLDLERGEPAIWDTSEGFDFELVDSVQDLEASVRTAEAKGFSSRLVAGFCWPWSDPNPDGSLVNDVKVGDWTMPWNAKADSKKVAKGIPKSEFWATDPNGIDQVGCVYTAQGFEFDHVGVIWGRDLVYRGRDRWVGQPQHSQDSVVRRSAKNDPDAFTKLVKHTYRVLLSRGMRSCAVYCEDEETRNFLISRTR